MSAEKTLDQLIQEMIDADEITEDQANGLRSRLEQVARAGSTYRDKAVRECMPVIIAAQFNLRQSFVDMQQIWNDHISTSDQIRQDSIATLNNVGTTTFRWDLPAARGSFSVGARHLPIPAHTRDFAIMFHHARGMGAPLESGNLTHPNTHKLAHYSPQHSNYPWTAGKLPDDMIEGLTMDAPTDVDSDEARRAIEWAAAMTDNLENIAASGKAQMLRAFAAQMAARTSDSNWEEKVKLSYYNQANELHKENWDAMHGEEDAPPPADHPRARAQAAVTAASRSAITFAGSRQFRNGTFGDAWASLQAIAASDSDAASLVSQLNNAATAFQRALGEFAQGWECMAAAATPMIQAYFELEDYGVKAGDVAMEGLDVLDRVRRFLTLKGGGSGRMKDLIKASRDLSSFIAKDRQKGIFNEQCFLLSYIGQISGYKKTRDEEFQLRGHLPGATIRPTKRLPSRELNASLLLDGDPYGFLNRLIQSESSKVFFNMKSDVLNYLQPMIRLYKVEYDEANEPYETEFNFDSHTKNIEQALQNTQRRGVGVGIKNFDFTYDGSNPFSVKKSIKATLKIFANSMDELFEERGNESRPISYIDLALKTRQPTRSNDNCASADPQSRAAALREANLSKLNFRLKAVIGWATPNGYGPWDQMSNLTTSENENRQALLDGIYNSYVTLNLTPTIHDFDFDEMGRVTFTIKYLAYIEDYYDTPIFNIFAGASMASDGGSEASTPAAPGAESEEGATPPAAPDVSNITAKQIIRNLRLQYYSRNCGDVDDVVDNVRENLALEANKEKEAVLQSLISNLKAKDRLYHINLPFEQVQFYNSAGPFHAWDAGGAFSINTDSDNSTAVEAEMQTAFASYDFNADVDADAQKVFKASLQVDSPTNYALSYFYVSDLIDSILEEIGSEIDSLPGILTTAFEPYTDITDCQKTMEIDKFERAKQNYKKLRILLGPVEFVNQGKRGEDGLGGRSKNVNFGDIPVSVRYFVEWLTAEMFKKDRTTYTLTTFLNNLFNKLVRDFLNNETCFAWNIKQKVRINQSSLTSYPTGGVIDEITQLLTGAKKIRANMSEIKQAGSPILNTSGPQPRGDDGFREFATNPIASLPVNHEMNYFVYFAGRTAPRELMKGRKEEDEAKGIFHYMLGRDRGLIKNIKLSKTDSRGLAEVRFEQDGYDGLKQLRVVYDVQIDSFADIKTYPGTYIFIDPRGFAPNTNLIKDNVFNLTQYGLGGYYMIVKSEHAFGAGQANSTIYAKWVNSIEATAQEQSDADNDSGSGAGITRCSSVVASAPPEVDPALPS